MRIGSNPRLETSKVVPLRGEHSASSVVLLANGSFEIDHDTKYETVVLALGTLAAIPVVTSIGLVVVTGLLSW